MKIILKIPQSLNPFRCEIPNLLQEMEEEPDNFTLNEYTLYHKPTKTDYWLGNGPLFYGQYAPRDYGFSFADKYRFWKAVRPFYRKQKGLQRQKRINTIDIPN